jgi:hypothetical protein
MHGTQIKHSRYGKIQIILQIKHNFISILLFHTLTDYYIIRICIPRNKTSTFLSKLCKLRLKGTELGDYALLGFLFKDFSNELFKCLGPTIDCKIIPIIIRGLTNTSLFYNFHHLI